MEVLKREDRQEELKSPVRSLLKELEDDDLRVAVFMENTAPPDTARPRVIKSRPVVSLLKEVARTNKLEPGVAKVMFVSRSTGNSRSLTPTMGVGFQLVEPGKTTKPHYHNMASVYLVVKGKGYSVIDGKRYDWEEGDVFVVPANAEHSHTNTGEVEALLFDVTDSGLLENLGILSFTEMG